MMDKILSSKQAVANLDSLLEHTLNAVANGNLSVEKAHSGLAELIHLIDNRELGAYDWLKQGRKYMH